MSGRLRPKRLSATINPVNLVHHMSPEADNQAVNQVQVVFAA